MERIFFAHSFKMPHLELLRKELDDLLESHDVRLVIGEALGRGSLDEALKSEILRCDGFIALFTRDKAIRGGGYTTSDWVKDEYNFALDAGKNVVALVQPGVQVGGATGLQLRNREHIDIDPKNRLKALLKLSKILGKWRRDEGKPLKIHLRPTEIADRMRTAGANNGGLTWKCKCIADSNGLEETPKITSSSFLGQPGGVYVYLRGIKENAHVELEATDGRTIWKSSATPQWISVDFEERKRSSE